MNYLQVTVPFVLFTLGACTSTDGTTDAGGTDASTDGASTDAKGDGALDGGNATSVNLGTAANYAILAKSGLAKSGVSTVPTSAITGDVGVSPAAASYLTGFAPTSDSTNVFATSSQVTGKLFASDYANPTPSNLTTAISDMQLAFTDAAGRAPNVTNLGAETSAV